MALTNWIINFMHISDVSLNVSYFSKGYETYIFFSQYFRINVNSFVNPTCYKDNTTVEKYVSFLSPRLIFVT